MISPALILLFNLIAGTLCLVYGVNQMSRGLEKANTVLMRKILSVLTGKLLSSLAAGTVLTALVQSSTAVTIMTVGFVNSGLMKLPQAIGVIYGANIGTTITAQLMSFKLTGIAFPLVLAGFLIGTLSKKATFKNLGNAVLGFGFMLSGIGIMNSGVPYIKESTFAYEIFRDYGQNPFAGLLIGILATMMVQSSSATVGLTIVLFNAGLISFEAAIGLTLGDNIGTCITAQISSLGTSICARRTAWAHTLYNVIGVLIALLFLRPFANLIQLFTYLMAQDRTRLVANTHTVFNVLSAIVFLPVTRYYVKFIEWIIPDKKSSP